MSSEIALRLSDVGKKYVIRHQDHDHVTLAQAALHRLRHPRGGAGREEFWALRGVNLEVPRGEVLGVIGHNGAGKSTLLKVLSRITPPSTGAIEVFGRIGSLLEVGTGFHPELTGRENVYLNGAILGMRRKEIDRRFDEIVDFSGVERFLDTPVKRFSSGMYVRLAFAVAAHLDTEILLLDEVLAVGDPDFQRRSVAQIKKLAKDGRTVLFVSHNRDLVAELTTTAAAFEGGRLVEIGPTGDVLERQFSRTDRQAAFVRASGLGRQHRFTSVQANAERSEHGDVTITVHYHVESDVGCAGWRPNFTLRAAGGVSVANTFGPVFGSMPPAASAMAEVHSQPLPLAPGPYSLDVSLSTTDGSDESVELVDLVIDACVFDVPELQEGAWQPQWGFLNISTYPSDESVPLSHHSKAASR